MTENQSPPQPVGEPLFNQDEQPNHISSIILWCGGIAVLLGLIFWGLVSCDKATTKKKEIPATTFMTAREYFSNGVFQISRQMEGVALGMSSNLVKLSGELSEIVSSNQTVTTQQMEALRVETLGTVTNLVEASVAKAMEPYKRLLTNPPPPAPVVAPAKPPLVINNQNLVTVTTNITTRVETPSVIINNQNWVGGPGANPPPPPQPPAAPPYWMRPIFPNR